VMIRLRALSPARLSEPEFAAYTNFQTARDKFIAHLDAEPAVSAAATRGPAKRGILYDHLLNDHRRPLVWARSKTSARDFYGAVMNWRSMSIECGGTP